MGKHTSTERARPARIHDSTVEGWPTSEPTLHALDDPDIGVDSSAFYRWRRSRSEPPPPLGPSGSVLARYRKG